MTINIANAPCSWGVDYADDINNPDWKNVFKQIAEAGYSYCEICLLYTSPSPRD